jgi:hypothetical protein
MPVLGIIASSISGNLSSPSFQSIASANGTGASNTITFSSIPSTYKSLQIRILAKDTATGTQTPASANIQFNGDTGFNYSFHYMYGSANGSNLSVASASSTEYQITQSIATSRTIAPSQVDIYGVSIVDIIDYASTSKNKTMRTVSGVDGNEASAAYRVQLNSGAWYSTAAVSSISIKTNNTAFTTGTTMALYGVK